MKKFIKQKVKNIQNISLISTIELKNIEDSFLYVRNEKVKDFMPGESNDKHQISVKETKRYIDLENKENPENASILIPHNKITTNREELSLQCLLNVTHIKDYNIHCESKKHLEQTDKSICSNLSDIEITCIANEAQYVSASNTNMTFLNGQYQTVNISFNDDVNSAIADKPEKSIDLSFLDLYD